MTMTISRRSLFKMAAAAVALVIPRFTFARTEPIIDWTQPVRVRLRFFASQIRAFADDDEVTAFPRIHAKIHEFFRVYGDGLVIVGRGLSGLAIQLPPGSLAGPYEIECRYQELPVNPAAYVRDACRNLSYTPSPMEAYAGGCLYSTTTQLGPVLDKLWIEQRDRAEAVEWANRVIAGRTADRGI